MICKLKEICSYRTEKINVDEIKKDDYISTDNLLPNFAGIGELKTFPTCGNINKYCKGDILISNIRPYFKKMIYSNKLSGCSTDVLVIKSDEEKVNSKYLYYSLMCDNFFDYVMLTSKGTKMPRGDKNSIMNYEVMVPTIENQNKIVDILDSLNSKIKLNNEINNNLCYQS